MSESDVGSIGARSLELVLQGLGNEDARHLVVQAQREPVARQGKDSDENGDRARATQSLDEAVEMLGVEDDLRHREFGSRFELLLEALQLDVHVVWCRIDGDAGEERGGRIDR